LAFRNNGGKLLMYHGWADQLISPENSISYRTSAEARDARDKQQRCHDAPALPLSAGRSLQGLGRAA